MAKNMELAFQIKSNMDSSVISSFKSVESAMKSMDKQIKSLRDQEKSLKGLQEMKKGANEAQKNLILTNKEIEKASKKLQVMKQAYEKSGKSNEKLNKAIKEQEKHIAKLNKQAERQKKVFHAARSEIENSDAEMRKYGTTIDQTRQQIERLERQQAKIKKLDKLQTGLNDRGEKMIASGRSQMMRGTAQAAAVFIPVKFALDEEESFAGVKKVANMENSGLGQLRKELQGLTKEIPVTVEGMYEIAEASLQAGIGANLVGEAKIKEVSNFTKLVAKSATAMDISEAQAGEWLATWKQNLKLSNAGVQELADRMNHLSDMNNAKAEDIANIFSNIMGTGKVAGFTESQMIALATSIKAAGVDAEQAGTHLDIMMSRLGKGDRASKQTREALKAIGLDAQKVANDMQKPGQASEVFLDVLEKIQKLPAGERLGIANHIFGGDAGKTAAKLVANTDILKSNLEEMGKMDWQGSIDREFESRSSTNMNKLKLAWNSIKLIAINAGASMADTLGKLALKSGPFFDKINAFVQNNPKLVSGILAAVAGLAMFNLTIGAGKLMFGNLLVTAGKAVGLFKRFQMFKAAGGMAQFAPAIAKIGMAIKGVFAALIAGNPIAWIIAGIVAVVAGFVLLYKKSEWFRNGVNKAFQMIKPHAIELGNVIKNYIGKAFEKLKEYADKYGPKLKEAFNQMKPAIKVIGKLIVVGIIKYIKLVIFNIKMIVKVLKFLWPALKMIGKILIMSIFNPLKLVKIAFKAIWDVIKAVGKAIWNYIGKEIEKAQLRFNKFKMIVGIAFRYIKFIAQSVFRTMVASVQKFVTGTKAKFDGVKTKIHQIWDSIKTKASDIWNNVLNKVKDFIKNFKDAIKDAIDWVKEKWNDITNLKMPSLSSFFLGGGQEPKPDGRYTGDSYYKGGMTWLAERGRELVKYPSGQISLVNNKSMGYLPKGTKIFNNSATEKMLTPRKSLGERVDDLKERFKKITTNNNTTVVSHGGDTITIHVHAAPGQDENVIANIVMRKIEEAKRKKERKDF